MKTMFFAAVVLLCIACSQNEPLTDSEQQAIVSEVKEVTAVIHKAAEECKIDDILGRYYEAPGMMIPADGKLISFKEASELARNMFSSLSSQVYKPIAESYVVLDKSTVIHMSDCSWRENFKDGKVVLQEPWHTLHIFKKVNNEWKVAAGSEYGHEDILTPPSVSSEFSQVDLSKQFLGTWKDENLKDTVTYFIQQPYGNGQIVDIKTTVKGKTVSEGIQLWGFDKNFNAITVSQQDKNGGTNIRALKFLTAKTYTMVPYLEIANPELASFRVEGELTSSDVLVEKVFLNGKLAGTYKFTRMR